MISFPVAFSGYYSQPLSRKVFSCVFLHENPGQWARNMTDRAYFHSVRLWRVHFVAMNSGAVNSNFFWKNSDV